MKVSSVLICTGPGKTHATSVISYSTGYLSQGRDQQAQDAYRVQREFEQALQLSHEVVRARGLMLWFDPQGGLEPAKRTGYAKRHDGNRRDFWKGEPISSGTGEPHCPDYMYHKNMRLWKAVG